MLLIFLSFITIFILCSIVGIGANRLLGIKETKVVETLFIGLFTLTILASIWAFFMPIDYRFHLSLSIICAFVFYRNSTEIISFLKLTTTTFQNFTKFIKVLFCLTFVMILMQAATAPFLIDNESYYIQTIKSLNEYGLIKGLGNLHLFLGQMSGWHIAQSAVNFHYIFEHFNDLSAFALLITNFWSFTHLDKYIKSNLDPKPLILGLFVLGNILFFRFINSPSPDVAIFCLTFICFGIFIDIFSQPNRSQLLLLWCLTMFCVYIKVTSVVLVFLPIVLLVKDLKYYKAVLSRLVLISLVVFTLFITKNTLITGMPLYPTAHFDIFEVEWKVPKALFTLYYDLTEAQGFKTTPEIYKELDGFGRIKHWLLIGGVQGLVNKLAVLIGVLFPLLLWRKFKYKSIAVWLYIVFIVQLILLLNTSPQYRFFINMVHLMLCFTTAFILFIKINSVKYIIAVGVIAPLIPLIFSTSIQPIATNDYMTSLQPFKLAQLIIPHEKSQYDTKYSHYKKGNLEFYHPESIEFFWGTGDGPFPTLKYQQLNYFESQYQVIPQLLTDDIKDGFYSKPIDND